jgi:hypothetical protein
VRGPGCLKSTCGTVLLAGKGITTYPSREAAVPTTFLDLAHACRCATELIVMKAGQVVVQDA